MAGRQSGTAELLFTRARQMGLQPKWLVDDGLFVMFTASGERYINSARSSLNSDIGASLAKDKHLTRLILQRNDLPNIPFTRAATLEQARAFLTRHKKIIAKPVRGSGSQDIHIVTTVAELEALDIKKYILEKYIAGKEMRYLVLDNAVIGVYQSKYGTSVAVTRALECITYPQSTWDPALVASAVKTARILGLRFAAVDYLIGRSGRAYILEVNTTPDLKWFHAPTEGPPVDVAQLFLNSVLAAG